MRTEAERLLEIFTNAPGAPGREEAVRALVHAELAQHEQHAFEADLSGSLLCRRLADPPDGPRVMLTAHMDEVAFMVQNITADGFIQFVPLGGWWTHTLLAQAVNVITQDGRVIPGTVSSTPPHLLSAEARNAVMDIEKLFVDVGSASREETKSFGIRIGDPIVPATRFKRLANPDLLLAKAFDNRVGVSLLTQTMKALAGTTLPNQLLGVATVQEEVGCRGAVTAAGLTKPDVAFVLEGPPADDTPGFNRDDSQGKLGGGVQIRLFDPTAIGNHRLSSWVVGMAEEAGIAHQVTVRRSGGTDAKSIHLHDLGVPTIVLGVPARYIHSHHSMIHIADYLAALQLVEALLKNLDAETARSFTAYL